MLSICWTIDGHLEGNEREGFRSRAASNRYRILIPRQALIAAEHEVRLIPLPLAGVFPNDSDVLMLGKVYPGTGHQAIASSQSLDLARKARERGARVVVDVNDNHFQEPEVGGYWREAVRVATACVVGSEAMAKVVARHTDRPVHVIGDPLGSPLGEPAVYPSRRWLGLVAPKDRLEIVWYGGVNNVPAMGQWADQLSGLFKKHPFRIRIVTKRHQAVDRMVQVYSQAFPGAMEFVEWSEDAQWQAVAQSHLVMIPTDPSNEKKAVKTANRLTDAINAGRYVIASPLDSYRPFAEFCTLTHDPVEAVKAYLADTGEALAKLRRGQEAVRKACAVDQTWLKVLA